MSQDSVLGPQLLIQDLSESINPSNLLADDAKVVDSLMRGPVRMDLDTVRAWYSRWTMALNIGKLSHLATQGERTIVHLNPVDQHKICGEEKQRIWW